MMITKLLNYRVVQMMLFWLSIATLSFFSGFFGGGLRAVVVSEPIVSTSREPQTLVLEDRSRGASTEQQAAERVLENISQSMVALYTWKQPETLTISPDAFPKESQFVATALVVTSDGWLITTAPIEQSMRASLSAFTPEKKSFPVERIVRDPSAGYTFIKISEKNLRPIEFPSFTGPIATVEGYMVSEKKEISRIFVSPLRYPTPASAVERIQRSTNIVKRHNPNQEFSHWCMPVAEDERIVLGCTANKGMVSFRFAQRSLSELLKTGTLARPATTIPYIDLSESQLSFPAFSNGAFVFIGGKKTLRLKGDGIKDAVLMHGDTILKVNGDTVDANRNLSELLSQYGRGEKILLDVISGGEEKTMSIILN